MPVTLLVTTVLSLGLSGVMSVIVWHLLREERRRSDARVAALAADIHDDLELRPMGDAGPATTDPLLFAARESSRGGSRVAAAWAIGVFVAGSAAVVLVLVAGGSNDHRQSRVPGRIAESAGESARVSRPTAASLMAPTSLPSSPAPVELVALGLDRDGNRLTVRGVVRNPASAGQLDGLTAVVFLFDRAGDFLASSRASIDRVSLTPGAEAPFLVTIPADADVGRYRVSFRTGDRIVPHVDRRQHGSVAQLQ